MDTKATNDNSLTDNEKNTMTYGDKRREEKKQALREFLQGQKYIEAINNDLSRDHISAEELPMIKYKTETRLKLLSKVLPDLKAVEQTTEHSGTITYTWNE